MRGVGPYDGSPAGINHSWESPGSGRLEGRGRGEVRASGN